MNEKLDLRGLLCPEPVLATKRVFDKKETVQVESLVDDQVCVSNLERLARSLKAACTVVQKDGFFAVTLSKEGSAAEHNHGTETVAKMATASAEKNAVGTVVFITKDQLGEGDPDFSKTLLDVFLQSLYEGGHRPRAILLANTGVKLMAANARARKVLDDFREAGSEVLACGLCVDFYGLKQDIETKQITNMFAICEYLEAADKLLQF